MLIGYCLLPVSQASHVFGHKIFTGLSEQSAARHQDLASKQKGFNVGFGLIAAVRPCGVSVIFCAKHKSIRKLQYAVKFFYWIIRILYQNIRLLALLTDRAQVAFPFTIHSNYFL